MSNKKCEIMVGISTRQNTTNLVPFIQLAGKSLILLETIKAKKDKWSEGLKSVLKSRGKEVELYHIGEGTELNEMISGIAKLTKDRKEGICWNIGGGQKLQALALFSCFQNRVKGGRNDWLCYSDPQTKKTIMVAGCEDENVVKQHDFDTNANIELEEIVKTFNYRLVGNNLKCLWQRNGEQITNLKNIMPDDQLEYFFDFENRKKMFDYTLQVYKKLDVGNLGKVFPDDSKDFGQYFEKIVQAKVSKIVAAKPESHKINAVWANVEVSAVNSEDTKQEFDIVLVTNFGTLIPIDAKTYKFSKKDEDARKQNLNKVSGVYTQFWSVFPFMQRDLQEDSILQKDDEWKKLLRRPFEFGKRGSKMLVLSEPDSQPFEIFVKRNKVQVGKGKRSIKVLPIDTLIKSLNIEQI